MQRIQFVFWDVNPDTDQEELVDIVECEFRVDSRGKFPADLQALYVRQYEWRALGKFSTVQVPQE